jgi:hypothetical protein
VLEDLIDRLHTRTSRMICSGSIFKAMRPYAMLNLSPGYAIHDSCNLGFDFAPIIEAGDNG